MRSHQTMNAKRVLTGGVAATMLACGPAAHAATVAYWNFDQGVQDLEPIAHFAGPGGYSPDIADQSGNGNHLAVWETGGNAGYAYRTIVPGTPLQTGTPNQYSIKNTGGGPAIWTDKLSTWSPTAWTIEVSFKIEAGNYKTIIGRDSYGGFVEDVNQAQSALYLQTTPSQQLAIKFQDSAGYWQEAVSADNTIQGFDFPTDNDGVNAPWYSAAAVSDGSTLSLYLLNHDNPGAGYQLVAQSVLDASGDTSLSTGHDSGNSGDWDPGNFSFGRGLFDNNHGDRAYGFLDEIRFSDVALTPSEFLFIPEPASAALLGLGGVALAIRRRTNG